MPLTNDERELVDRASATAEGLVLSLAEGSKLQSSVLRDAIAADVETLRGELLVAVLVEDATAILALSEELDSFDDILEGLQEAALIEVTALYANFLDDMRDLTEGVQNSEQLLLQSAWMRSQRGRPKKTPMPPDVRQLYAYHAILRVEAVLGIAAVRVLQLTVTGTLNTDDIRRIRLGQVHQPAARAAIADHFRQQSLVASQQRMLEAENPGLLRQIWSVAGWDSWTEFGIDMGFLLVTGAGGAVIRFARKAAKAAKLKRRARAGGRLAKQLERYEEEVRKIRRAQQDVEKRLERSLGSRRRKQALEKTRDELAKRASEIVDQIWTVAVQITKDRAGGRELLASLEPAFDLLSKVGAAIEAEGAQRLAESAGLVDRGSESGGDIARTELAEEIIKWQLKAFEVFGTRIDNTRDAFVKSLGLRVGRPALLFRRWFYLLAAREFTTRILETLAHKGKVHRRELTQIIVSSLLATLEEILVEMKVPEEVRKRLGSKFTVHVAGFVSETLQGVIGTIANKLGDSIVD